MRNECMTNQPACCKDSMIAALRLLCDHELSEVVDFNKFAFMTDDFIVGSRYVFIKPGCENKDNLAPLSGKFNRFCPCSCDLIEIEGTAFYDIPLLFSIDDTLQEIIELVRAVIDEVGDPLGVNVADTIKIVLEWLNLECLGHSLIDSIVEFLVQFFTTLPEVSKASICALEAIAFETTDGEICPHTTSCENYLKAKQLFQCKLYRGSSQWANGNGWNQCCSRCNCDTGIKNELYGCNLSKTVTLTAGSLTLRDVTILGVCGNVLVLANDDKQRFYYVCTNKIQFIA